MRSFNLDEHTNSHIILILAKFSKFKFFDIDKELFKIGDPAENFFIVFSGRIKCFKLSKQKEQILKKDFILKLKKLKDNNDIFILRKTISYNRSLDINEYEIDRLYEKIEKMKEIKNKINFKAWDKLIKAGKYLNSFDFYLQEIDNCEIPENIADEEIRILMYENNTYPSPLEKIDDDRIFDTLHYPCISFYYELIKSYSEGDYFGESGENHTRRKYYNYYIAEENTTCLSISNNIFQKFITSEIEKIKIKEIQFLNENYIFRDIQRGTFMTHYLKYFTREEHVIGSVLFQEEKKVDKIYFIKEGKVQLNLNANILSLHSYVNELLDTNEEIKLYFQDFPLMPEIKNQPKNFMEQLKKKKFFSIFLLLENDILGLEESYFNFKHLYRATVKSEKVVVYSIMLKKFQKIIDFEPHINEDFKNYAVKKICNLIERILNVKNNTLQFLDQKYSQENNKSLTILNINNSSSYNNLKNISQEVIDFSNEANNSISYNHPNNLQSILYSTINNSKNNLNRPLIYSENNIDIKSTIKKYFEEFNDISKQLKKKYDLLQSRDNEQYTFYNDFNYEKSTIKNIQKEIKNLKRNSVYNILPNIHVKNSTINNLLNKSKEGTNTTLKAKEKNILNISVKSNSNSNSKAKLNVNVNEMPKNNKNSDLKKKKGKATFKESMLFMTNPVKIHLNNNESNYNNVNIIKSNINPTYYDYKNNIKNEKSQEIINLDSDISEGYKSSTLTTEQILAKNKNLITHKIKMNQKLQNSLYKNGLFDKYFNKDNSTNISSYFNHNSNNVSKFSTMPLLNSIINYNDDSKINLNSSNNFIFSKNTEETNIYNTKPTRDLMNKNGVSNTLTYNNQEKLDRFSLDNLSLFKKQKNIFVPFSVDNSIGNIKSGDKRMQMTKARKLYKNQTITNSFNFI